MSQPSQTKDIPPNSGLGPEIADIKHVRYVPSHVDEQRASWGNNQSPVTLDPTTTYEVERTEVHSWHTKVWLVGVGGPFNSVHFVPASGGTQS